MTRSVLVIGLYGQSIIFNVDEFPVDGETVSGNLISIEPGGKGYNQAVSVARNKVPVRFITAISDDEFGSHLFIDCKVEGIDGSFSTTLSRYHTAIASVMSDKHANSRVIVAKGACDEITPAYILDDAFSDCSILLLQLELPIELALYAAKKAKEKNAIVILDPAPAQALPKDLIDTVDIITPNLGEALKLSACSPASSYASIAQKMRELGYKNVLLTMGENGVYASLKTGEEFLVPAFKVDAVDSTGAGDTFNGALAANLYEGNDLIHAIGYATAASSLCVSKKGVIASIPYKGEIEKLMSAN